MAIASAGRNKLRIRLLIITKRAGKVEIICLCGFLTLGSILSSNYFKRPNKSLKLVKCKISFNCPANFYLQLQGLNLFCCPANSAVLVNKCDCNDNYSFIQTANGMRCVPKLICNYGNLQVLS